MGVVKIVRDETVADHRYRIELVRRLADDFVEFSRREIDRNDAAAWRIARRMKVEAFAVIAQKLVMSVRVGQQLHGSAAGRKVLNENPIARLGSFRHVDD